MNKELSETLDKLTEQLIILDQHQICLARNLFPRPAAKERRKNFKQSYDESRFLFFVFDCLHNVPELALHLVQIKKAGSVGINESLFMLVQGNLSALFSLIKSEEFRKEYGIKNSNKILSWTHCELSLLCQTVENILNLIPYVCYLADSSKEPCRDKEKIVKIRKKCLLQNSPMKSKKKFFHKN